MAEEKQAPITGVNSPKADGKKKLSFKELREQHGVVQNANLQMRSLPKLNTTIGIENATLLLGVVNADGRESQSWVKLEMTDELTFKNSYHHQIMGEDGRKTGVFYQKESKTVHINIQMDENENILPTCDFARLVGAVDSDDAAEKLEDLLEGRTDAIDLNNMVADISRPDVNGNLGKCVLAYTTLANLIGKNPNQKAYTGVTTSDLKLN
jgi:hypothetical protein